MVLGDFSWHELARKRWNDRVRTMAAALLVPLAASSWSCETDAALVSKTSADVIEAARRGEVQRLIVALQDDDIRERVLRKRLDAQGRPLRTAEEVRDENARAVRELVDAVFPNGRLGSAVIVEQYRHFPLPVVLVPDVGALNVIACHPGVKRVHRIERYHPAD